MKTDLFQSRGHCWVFQICWHIECITFTASSFRIWNGSTGILSLPLALFVVMLPKAHLTSHSRMSGCSWVWVITPSWLSGLWRFFWYSSSVYAVCLQRPYKSHVVNMCVRGPLHLFSTFSHVSPVVIQVSLKDLLVDSSFKNLASEKNVVQVPHPFKAFHPRMLKCEGRI